MFKNASNSKIGIKTPITNLCQSSDEQIIKNAKADCKIPYRGALRLPSGSISKGHGEQDKVGAEAGSRTRCHSQLLSFSTSVRSSLLFALFLVMPTTSSSSDREYCAGWNIIRK